MIVTELHPCSSNCRRNYGLHRHWQPWQGWCNEQELLGTTGSSLPAYAYCPIVVVPYTDDEGNLMHLNNTILGGA